MPFNIDIIALLFGQELKITFSKSAYFPLSTTVPYKFRNSTEPFLSLNASVPRLSVLFTFVFDLYMRVTKDSIFAQVRSNS